MFQAVLKRSLYLLTTVHVITAKGSTLASGAWRIEPVAEHSIQPLWRGRVAGATGTSAARRGSRAAPVNLVRQRSHSSSIPCKKAAPSPDGFERKGETFRSELRSTSQLLLTHYTQDPQSRGSMSVMAM